MSNPPPTITLFELGPTRSARCRWALLEAELEFESVGNSVEIFTSEELKRVNPHGKLPAAVINGKPLFESAAISTAIADLVPHKQLIGPSGSWERALHDQWVCFALAELEAWISSTEINSIDFVIPESEHVPDIIAQNNRMFRKSAAVLDAALANDEFLVANRFSVTDIIMGYTVNWADEQELLEDFPNIKAYLERLCQRPLCPLERHH